MLAVFAEKLTAGSIRELEKSRCDMYIITFEYHELRGDRRILPRAGSPHDGRIGDLPAEMGSHVGGEMPMCGGFAA